jgi:tRNA(Ile)-lysidine synthase
MVLRNRLTPAVADVRRAVRDALVELDLEQGARILVACSGGPDSLALAAATAFEAPKLGLLVAACVVDHGLQAGSDEIARQALLRLEALGVDPVVIESVSVKKDSSGPEAAARTARYQALEQARNLVGAELVVLGHNLEDQAETVLIGLTRGSGLKSISGMQLLDADKKLLRPLLGLKRELLRQSCIDQDILFWDDPHNKDERFTRVRVRNLLDKMETELGPGFAEALSRTAEIATESEDAISNAVSELLTVAVQLDSEGNHLVSISALESKPYGIRRKLLFEVAVQAGGKGVSRTQVLGIDELITNWHGQNKLVLSGITVERVNQKLVFTGQ